MKKDENSRLEVRRNLIFYLRIKDHDNGMDIGALGDITENGVLIISESMLHITDTLNIGIELPKGPDYQDKVLNLTVDVQWTKKDPDNPELALSGCRIIGMQKGTKDVIEKLIRNLGFSNGQRKIMFSDSISDFTE